MHSFFEQRGASLIGLLVGLAVGIIAVTIAMQLVENLKTVEKSIVARDVMSDLQYRVQESVASQGSMGITIAKNKSMRGCLFKDNKICKLDLRPFDLWLAGTIKISGSYDADGRYCEGSNDCIFKIRTEYMPECNKKPCDQAQRLNIYYQVLRDKSVVRSGRMIHKIKQTYTGDNNTVCAADDKGNPQFVSKIHGGKIACSELKAPTIKLSGVKPGRCNDETEILAGVVGGKIVCEKIVMTKK